MAEKTKVLTIYLSSGSTIQLTVDADKYQHYFDQWLKILAVPKGRRVPIVVLMAVKPQTGENSFMIAVPDEVEAVTLAPDAGDPSEKQRSALATQIMETQLEMMKAARNEQRQENSWKGDYEDE